MMFKVSSGCSYVITVATGWLLCQGYAGQSGAIPQAVVLSSQIWQRYTRYCKMPRITPDD